MKKTKLFFVAIAYSTNLFAQQTDSVKKHQFTPIIIQAIRAGSYAPFAKTDIKQEEIAAVNNGADLPILLNTQTGVVTNSDAGTGVGYTGIRLRGSDMSRINITLNGVPVNDAESQAAYFVDLPDMASSTQSIELTRGIGSSTNGAGAFGGTLSINSIDLPSNAHISYQSNVGTFNTWRNTLKLNTGLLHNKFNASIRLSKISSNGYIQRSASQLSAMQINAAHAINNSTSLLFCYMAGAEKTGQAWNGVPQDSLATNRTYNELGQKTDGSFYANQTDNYLQEYFQLFLNKNINNNWKLNIGTYLTKGKGYYEEYKTAQNYADYYLPNAVFGTDTLTTTDLIRQLWLKNYLVGAMATSIATLGNTTLTMGLHYNNYVGQHYGIVTWAQQGIADNYTWYKQNADKEDASAFIKIAQKINNKLYAFADVQARNVWYNIDGFRKNPTLFFNEKYTFFNPKFGATYFIRNSLNNFSKIYASIAIANKEPNRDDFETNIINKPKYENLQDAEIGYHQKTKNVECSANVYYMNYTNQLVLVGNLNDVGATVRTNVAKSYRTGIELSLDKWQVNKQLFFCANIAFSKNKIPSFTEIIDDYDHPTNLIVQHSNTDISFSPNCVAAVFTTFSPIKNLNFTAQYKYVSKQYLDNTQNENRKINAYVTVDLFTSYKFLVQQKTNITAKFSVQNVLNNLYVANGYTYSYVYSGLQTFNYYYPQAGMRFNFGLALDL